MRGQVPKKWNGEDTNSDVSDPEGTPLPPKKEKIWKREDTNIDVSDPEGTSPPKKKKIWNGETLISMSPPKSIVLVMCVCGYDVLHLTQV